VCCVYEDTLLSVVVALLSRMCHERRPDSEVARGTRLCASVCVCVKSVVVQCRVDVWLMYACRMERLCEKVNVTSSMVVLRLRDNGRLLEDHTSNERDRGRG
jgi:hypothetical protein